MASLHSIRAWTLVLAAAAGWNGLSATVDGQQPSPAAPPGADSSFTILLRGLPVGSEQIAIEQTAGGWTITSSGRIGAPLDIVTRRLQVRYDADWKPLELSIDATIRGQTATLHTTVTGTTAKSDINNNGVTTEKTDTIDSAAILLPNPGFAPYEALAARLRTAAAGSAIPVYVAPQGSMTATVGESQREQIQTAARLINARRTRITVHTPGALPLEAEVWADADTARLLRVSVPAQGVEFVREDIASVAARRVPISRPGDEQVRIPANGFSLAGTLSKPAGATGRMPAIVLAGGSGPADRDETVFGIPIFGQLAGALADAGFLVLRYDKRGVGQSGGRVEAAGLADFADDLRAVVRFVSDRNDVDRRRVAIAGHSEGGSVGMLTAARENRVAALVLIAAMGVTGAELNLAQVAHSLDRTTKSEADKQATIDLQKKIQQAVLTGKGWEEIPPALRLQADTPWFHSFLSFDPARVMRDVDQPILIVHGLLDTQVPPSNADRLEVLARARKNAPVKIVKIPGVNHLLVPAATGEVDEYGTLTDKQVSPQVSGAIAAWLQKIFGITTPR